MTPFRDILALSILSITIVALTGAFIWFCIQYPIAGLMIVVGAAIFWALVHFIFEMN